MRPTAGRQNVEAKHFDDLAEEIGEIWWGSTTKAGKMRLERRGRLLAERLKAYTDPLAVELGCGTGAFSQYILKYTPGLRLHGIDVSPKSVAVASERLQRYQNASFRVDDAIATDYEDASVEAVVGNSVLHHLPLEQALAEAYRVLKPGGTFWFSEPNMMNPQIAIEKNVKFIGRILQNTPDETAFFRWPLQRLLSRVGFDSVSVEPFDFLHPIVPRPLASAVSAAGSLVERMPLLREISGSLLIVAIK